MILSVMCPQTIHKHVLVELSGGIIRYQGCYILNNVYGWIIDADILALRKLDIMTKKSGDIIISTKYTRQRLRKMFYD